MTRIHGQIESLKRIRETLDHEGITRFNSTGDIQKFLQNYDIEKEELLFKTERIVDLELDVLRTRAQYLQRDYEQLKSSTEIYLKTKIQQLETKCEALAHPAKNTILEILRWYRQQVLFVYQFILKKNINTYIWIKTYSSKKYFDLARDKTNTFSKNREATISERYEIKYQNLERTKKICDRLYSLIAGAIGEHRVAKELEKLPDDFVLINDFSFRLEKPIYYREESSLIRSIQIDHLLITNAGIFIIETKNWSKASINNLDLRSPIQQIKRSSYALFILLNPKDGQSTRILKKHHWGKKKLPVKNIVAMIHHKPKDQFNHVVIKKLKELNDYITYFEPLFDSNEVRNIADLLISWNEQQTELDPT